MRIDELTVTPESGNWNKKPLVALPYDMELISPLKTKVLHKAGTKVTYEILKSHGSGFKVKLYRTVYSIVLTYDSRREFIDDGFEINAT